MNKKIQSISATAVATILLCSCNQTMAQGSVIEETEIEVSEESGEAIPTTLLDVSALFSSRDKEIGYEESDAVSITLKGDTAISNSDKVNINGGTVTISDAGTYVISGSLSDGQIIVDAEKTDKIQLVLDGADIHCETSAPLYIRQGDKVFITLAQNSVNTISNAREFVAIDENDIDAVLFSKEDLTINGNGALTITTAVGNGIVSKDSLTITGGTIAVQAENHGVSAKDSICILDGDFQIKAGKDGFHSENKDDAALGLIYIGGGSYHVDVAGDGFDAGAIFQADNGTFQITTAQSEDATQSTKGIKATGDLLLNGGKFTLDTYDDAIHTNGNLIVNGGTYAVATGDDGMHADKAVIITDGLISISKSYEGIEGETISVYNGEITVISSDDGLNAAEKTENTVEEAMPQPPEKGMVPGGRGGGFGVSQNCAIEIFGGKLTIHADGDGIDSNGTLTIAGGEVYVAGPSIGADSALDCDGEANITGGVVVTCGASGMFRGFGSASTQGWISYGLTSAQIGEISLETEGETVLSFLPEKQYSSVIISAPSIQKGVSYTLNMGEETQTITLESLSYSGGNMTNGFGGGRGGMGQGIKPERSPLENNNGSTQAS